MGCFPYFPQLNVPADVVGVAGGVDVILVGEVDGVTGGSDVILVGDGVCVGDRVDVMWVGDDIGVGDGVGDSVGESPPLLHLFSTV